ncbi:hypothetical protein Q7689_02800 [Nocardiopsis tropica]|jgi:hypothetical protein|nr:hypothetical protein [Nocardiopsis tropica]
MWSLATGCAATTRTQHFLCTWSAPWLSPTHYRVLREDRLEHGTAETIGQASFSALPLITTTGRCGCGSRS